MFLEAKREKRGTLAFFLSWICKPNGQRLKGG